MSKNELRDLMNEADEQREKAEELKLEVEQHKDRVEKLKQLSQEINATQQDLGSDEIKHAQIAAEKAQSVTQEKLGEARAQRDKLLEDNQRLIEKVNKAWAGRRDAMEKIGVLELLSQGAPGEVRANVDNARTSIALDQGNLAEADVTLASARRELEAIEC